MRFHSATMGSDLLCKSRFAPSPWWHDILSSCAHRTLFAAGMRRGAQWSGRNVFGERQRVLVSERFRGDRPLSVALR